ncbi:hypothetical protein LTR97_001868 [Elasticomyces elasticus]|uniref:Uncharacterized protein n=1 Tax=Elasticomyces elasticus TaxID=574655 RepID=A0AAN7WII2_9PEZI|nr:hypothetical protein LTR97_001868 [Elasticomyces elasticus]
MAEGGEGHVGNEGLAPKMKSSNKENKPPRKSRAAERSRVKFSPTPPESDGDHDDGIERVGDNLKLLAARRQKKLAEERERLWKNGWQQDRGSDLEVHKQSTDLSEPRTSGRIRGSRQAEQQNPYSHDALASTNTRKANGPPVQSPRRDSRHNTAAPKASKTSQTSSVDRRQRPRKSRKAHQVDTHAPDQHQSGSAKTAPVSELATNTGGQQHTSVSKGWVVSGVLKQLSPSGYSLVESWVLVDGSGRTQQQLKDGEEEAEVEVEAESNAEPSEHGSEYATEDGEGVSDGESDVEILSGDEDGGHS